MKQGAALLRIETHIYLAPFLCLGLKTLYAEDSESHRAMSLASCCR